jgi:hypothetical protein
VLQKTTEGVYRMVFFSGILVNVKPANNLLSVTLGLGAEGWTGQIKGTVRIKEIKHSLF